MSVIEILGYIGALIVGVSLGLVGGGGSVLAVPVLAYLFSIEEKAATAYSLFVVGTSALLGGIRQHHKGYVHWRMALVFGVPSIIGVAVVRKFLVPALPDVIWVVQDFAITRRMLMFGLFALLMIPSALYMLRDRTPKRQKVNSDLSFIGPLIIVEGLFVGGLTGLIGAGGGFLIIPALVILANLKMKMAVGTSLIIIAVKSLLGFFLGDAMTMSIDWNFLLVFTILALIGIYIGSYLSNFVDGRRLKKGFGYFVLSMAIFIFCIEFLVA